MKGKILLIIYITSQILANNSDTSSNSYVLDKTVITASGFTQDLKDAPASISTISGKELENIPYRDLGDSISLLPGVSINQDTVGSTGFNISIRGMPSTYTLILIDGKRQNVTPSAFPNGYDSIFTSFMPPLEAIERIEVIRGPMSTLYGSDAIGGVVNIITKKTFSSWHGSVNLSSILQERSAFGNLYNGSFYASGPIDKAKKWGLQLRGGESYRAYVSAKDLSIIPTQNGENAEVGRSMIVGGMESNVYNLGGRLSLKNDENYFYFDYTHANQWLNKYPGQGAYASPSDPQDFFQDNFVLSHEGNYDLFNINTFLQYNQTLYKGRFLSLKDKKIDRGLGGKDILLTSKLNIPVSMSMLTLGGEYWFSSLNDKNLKSSVDTSFIYQNNISLFAENEIPIAENLILTLGIRENYNFAFGFNTSPRAYLVYNPFDYLTFKGGFSTGYKVPTPAQLIDGINGSSGTSTITRITYGNPNLLPETSINFELSILSQTNYTDFGITAFYNKFNNKILDAKDGAKLNLGETLPIGQSLVCSLPNSIAPKNGATTNCFYPINTGEAVTYGLETFFGFLPFDIGIGTLGININYTLIKTMQTSGKDKGKPLLNIPEHNLNGQITYDYKKKFQVYLRSEFYARQPKSGPGWLIGGDYTTVVDFNGLKKLKPDVSEYFNPYFLLHLGAIYQLTPTLKLNFAIYNLLNENFSDWFDVNAPTKLDPNHITQFNTFNYVHEGRRYYLSLNMDF